MKKKITLLLITIISLTFYACSNNPKDLPFELTTHRTDQLTLDLEYENKSYLEDGIGIAILASCEDGDTAEFIVDNQQIRVRFLGVDTPEASHYYEPWGYHATQYVCSRLETAETIVLERNFQGTLYDNYGRYLAFVWYDGRLINLEVIEQAYSATPGASSLKYGNEMLAAYFDVVNSGRHIYGEVDPLFDYSTTGELTSIPDIVNNSEDYNFKVVTVEGLITNMMGIHAYLEQDGVGIYFYIGYTPSSALEVGNIVRLENVRVIYDLARRGGVHLTGFSPQNTSVIGTNTVEPLSLTLDAISNQHHGRLIAIDALMIDSIESMIDGSIIMVMKDQFDNAMIVIHPREILPSERIDFLDYSIGNIVHLIVTPRDSTEGTVLLLTNKVHIELTEIE